MNGKLGRREIVKGGLIAGIGAGLGLSLPGRALAKGLSAPTTLPLQAEGAFASVTASVPASASSASPYEQRILAVAQREAGRVRADLWRTDLVAVADFAQPSWKPRFHFANLEDGTVRSFLLAHGRGSDPQHSGWLQSFSNQVGSLATSRGAFLTCEWYKGKYGTSIRLQGLDTDNSRALERAIVVHPAWYVDQAMIEKWGKLGRSEGCFAMSQTNFNEALWHLSGGRLLFADRIGEA